MALIVEDGTGKTDAESYLSETDADTYWTEHGDPSAWSGATAPNKEAALRYATAYLDGRYGWRGFISKSEQALDWPRNGVYDDEGRLVSSTAIPNRLKQATAEMALNHINESLSSPEDRPVNSVKVDVIDIEFEEHSPTEQVFTHVDRLLAPLVSGSVSQVELLRG